MGQASVATLYDTLVASAYDEDAFQIFSTSLGLATAQLTKHVPPRPGAVVVNLAVGTGNSLLACRGSFPGARLVGFDISEQMLERAHRKLPLESFHEDARNLSRRFPDASVDAVLMHFLLSYVPASELIPLVAKVLKPGGWLSIGTSTTDTFARLRTLGLQLGTLTPAAIAAAHVPDSVRSLDALLSDHGLEPVEAQDIRVPVVFQSFDELRRFGLHSSWLTQFWCDLTDAEMAGASAALSGSYPLRDEFRATVLLCRKAITR